MKIMIGLFLIWWSFVEAAMFLAPSSPSVWFLDPLRPLTGGAKNRYVQYEPIKPDLTLVKNSIFFPYSIQKDDVSYYGVLALKVNPKGGHEVSGAVYREDDFDKASLISGELIEHPTHYEIITKSRAMAPMMRTKKAYTEITELPIRLEIRSNGEDSRPYLSAALSEAGVASFFARSVDENIEKTFTGRFSASIMEGKWTFNLQKLGPLQVTGTAYFKSSESRNLDCSYPVYGFSHGWSRMIIMTGEDSQGRPNCWAHAWNANAERDMWYEMKSRTPASSQLNIYSDDE
ncbi:MAG: hypothetical protein KF789_07430 [Bdellovibrionaceae bacterium]|nr:hypothetical protein [Pseudobdellovibrionaceae bacterium]